MVDTNSTSNRDEADKANVSLSLSTIFQLLANKERRIVLHILRDRGGEPVEVRKLAEEVAAMQLTEVTWNPIEVETTLRHVHLPKLADAGLIEYDDRRGTVRYHGHPHLDSGLQIAKSSDMD